MRTLLAIVILLLTAQCARAALIISGTESYASGNNDSNITLHLPASIAVGDLLLVQINFGSSSTVTAPAGWTLLRQDTNGTDRQYLYYHVVVTGDTAGAAVSWSFSNSVRIGATLIRVTSNISGRTPVLGNSGANSGDSATLTAGSVTASAAGLLLRFYGIETGNTTFTLPSGLTQIVTATSTSASNGSSALVASHVINAAGASGSDTVTASHSGDWIAQSLLLTESQPAKPATCFTDNFSNTSAFAQNWVTTSVGTTAFTPAISNGRLQLTSDGNYISTGATLQRIFPTSNLLYVEFNLYSYDSSNGADGIAVTLSDASVTPQPGGFGGSLGYAQRSGVNGFAGGWLGVALDEYGNFSNPTEGRNGGPARRIDSVAVRGSGSGQTGYAYVAGTATLGTSIDSSSNPGPGHRYRIIIDATTMGQTNVTVDRDTSGAGTSYTNLIPTFNIQSAAGQAPLPANLILSLTGSTGSVSNIHEIDNLSVCATTINTATQVDHFEITHDGEGLTCEPENITINACANASCSPMSTPVTVTLNPSSGWSSNPVTFIGSTTVQLRQTTAGTAAISVASSSPGAKPFSTNKCNGVNSNSCNLSFVNAGFSFDVPNLLANKPSGAVRLRAVKNSGDANNSCVALFQNTTQSVNFWSTYTSPAAGTRPVELGTNPGSNIFTSISGSASPPTALNLSFDNNGETFFEARYQDAGLMQLNARYTADSSGPYADLVLTGSDSFVSAPAGFCVRGAKSATTPSYANCTSDFASCPVIATVLNPFVLDITAAAWEVDGDTDFCVNNGNVPNYSQSFLTLSSQFGLTAAEFNASGTASNGAVGRINNGVITTPGTVNISAGSGGNVNITDATESEVGAFEFVVTPPAYFGVTVPSAKNRPVGRFIPHHFAVNGDGNLINRATSCDPQPIPAPAFNYMGERFDLTFAVIAQNALNEATQNYQGVFAKLSSFSNLSLKAVSPVTSASRTVFDSNATNARLTLFDAINNPMSASWTNGTGSFNLPLTLARVTSTDGPYASTALGVAPVDSDGVATTGIAPPAFGPLLPFNLDTKATSNTIYDHARVGGTTAFRYGRLRLDSVSGPANLSLVIPITADYWNGSGFVTNDADTNCTTIVINNNTVSLGPYSGNLNDGETIRSDNSGFIVSGKAPSLLQLSAPGNGNEGSVGVTLGTGLWPWLQFDWNGDGTADTDAKATASFGIYRGSDRVIFWQENK